MEAGPPQNPQPPKLGLLTSSAIAGSQTRTTLQREGCWQFVPSISELQLRYYPDLECLHFKDYLYLKKTPLKGIPGQWKFPVKSGQPKVAVFEHPEPGSGGADDNEMMMRTGPEMSCLITLCEMSMFAFFSSYVTVLAHLVLCSIKTLRFSSWVP